MATQAQAPGRTYGGQDTQQRRAGRRERMLHAARDLFSQREGATAATVERICTQAGVATRSVYEEFGSREGLLIAVYTEVINGARAEIEAAMIAADDNAQDRVRAAMTSYVRYITEDVRRARIAHVSMRRAGDWALEARMSTLQDIMAPSSMTFSLLARPHTTGEHDVLEAIALSGAVDELIAHWAQHETPPAPDAIIELTVRLLEAFLNVPAQD